jgi:transcriptional regulator GlxA family with amidase domain
MTVQIAIGLFPGFTSLDAIGPYQAFVDVPGVELVFCAARSGMVIDDHGLTYQIERSFAEVEKPDVLVIPGGTSAYRLARDSEPIVDWIRTAHPTTTYTTSVCTGALLLGAAGLLERRPATTHWTAYDELRTYGAQPTEQRVVIDGKVITAAGVSAGIDMALTMVGQLFGVETAQAVQLGIEYDPQPPFDAGAPSKADPQIRAVVETVLQQRRAASSA